MRTVRVNQLRNSALEIELEEGATADALKAALQARIGAPPSCMRVSEQGTGHPLEGDASLDGVDAVRLDILLSGGCDVGIGTPCGSCGVDACAVQ